jgi:hypothetical protein
MNLELYTNSLIVPPPNPNPYTLNRLFPPLPDRSLAHEQLRGGRGIQVRGTERLWGQAASSSRRAPAGRLRQETAEKGSRKERIVRIVSIRKQR